MNATRRKLVAFGAVAAIVMAGMFVTVSSDDEQEVEAFTPSFWAGVAIGFGAGFVSGLALASIFDDDQSEELSRMAEARILASSLSGGVSSYINGLSQYANMWPLTDEHWIRQAELSATALWSDGAAYDFNAILDNSGVYYNMGQGIDNLTSQINAHWNEVSERVVQWNSTDYAKIYGEGLMNLELVMGNRTLSAESGSEFTMNAGIVLRDVSSSANKAWFAGGPIWASEAGSISKEGVTYQLKKGWNTNIPDTENFDAGIWTFQSGITYCGNIVPVFGSHGAEGVAGIVAEVGGQTAVITVANYDASSNSLKPDCDVYDGSAYYDTLSMRIVPQEEQNAQIVDITDILARLQLVLVTMESTLPEANTAAATVWNMFNASGEANAYLTTLMVPETYNNVRLTQEQREIITALAMEQLYMWWGDNRTDITNGEYQLTFDSMSLYCRGNVVVSDYVLDGESNARQMEYQNVIFTPIFYEDYQLKEGNNSIDGYGFVVIWGQNKSLSSFKETDLEDVLENAELIYIGKGATLEIAPGGILYSNQYVQSVNLDAANIQDIDPDVPIIPSPIEPETGSDLAEMIRLILVLLGAGLLLCGAYSRSMIWVFIGIVVIAAGFLFSDMIADAIERWEFLDSIWPF